MTLHVVHDQLSSFPQGQLSAGRPARRARVSAWRSHWPEQGHGERMTELAQVEVSVKAKRVWRSAAEKLRILKAADACTKVGELGALLRREGIYSSSLSNWRRARDLGELDALGPKRRGPKPVIPDARDKRIAELEKAVVKAELRAKRAEGLVELQKKVSELLGIQLPKEGENP